MFRLSRSLFVSTTNTRKKQDGEQRGVNRDLSTKTHLLFPQQSEWFLKVFMDWSLFNAGWRLEDILRVEEFFLGLTEGRPNSTKLLRGVHKKLTKASQRKFNWRYHRHPPPLWNYQTFPAPVSKRPSLSQEFPCDIFITYRMQQLIFSAGYHVLDARKQVVKETLIGFFR